MRKEFAEYIIRLIDKDKRVVLVTADLGYGLFDEIKQKFPDNFINCGAAEQLMMGICVGLSYQGKIPVAYSITPFLIFRPFEMIRNYINHEKLNIKLVGSGRTKDYGHDGFSHWAEDDEIIGSFQNIRTHWPTDDIKEVLDEVFAHNGPDYINLKR